MNVSGSSAIFTAFPLLTSTYSPCFSAYRFTFPGSKLRIAVSEITGLDTQTIQALTTNCTLAGVLP
jgi:hypothetical protein